MKDVPPLPPLPSEFNTFLGDSCVSALSHILCLIFSFASLESSAEFPSFGGPPGFFAVHGRLYHRVCPTHENSAVCWLLYDGFMADRAPHQKWAKEVPADWIKAVSNALLQLNPFVSSLRQLSLVQHSTHPDACLILQDRGTSPEVSCV